MKPHAFKGAGPGYRCMHVESGANPCGGMVADSIHVTVTNERHAFQGLHGGRCQAKNCDQVKTSPVHAGLEPIYVKPVDPLNRHVIDAFKFQPAEDDFWPGSAEAVWRAHADAVRKLLETKRAYGKAWQDQGYMGNVGRILSKASRLKNMCWQDNDFVGGGTAEGEESVLDTLYDLSALCAFAIANIEEGNRWGR